MLPEGSPYQLVQGELLMSPSPTYEHQRVVAKLGTWLFQWVERLGLGEVIFAPMDVYLSETDVYQPDIVFVAQGRLKLTEEGKIEGAPDMVIEVLSPGTAYYDLRTKKDVYEAAGVREYWIVDPIQKSIEIYSNGSNGLEQSAKARGKGTVSSRVVGEFRIELEKLFPPCL
jgi:Uma2 family endonuclease